MKNIFPNKIQLLIALSGLLIVMASSAYAIPSLQIYIPGSTYDATTQTWVTTDSNFELQVLGASSPAKADYITNLTLYMAINSSESGLPGAYVNINGSPITFSTYGTPPSLPTHGIYPTYYGAYSLPNLMVSTAGETVNNYNPGESGSDSGDIHYLQVDWGGYSDVHFDVTGTVVDNSGKTWETKAPFSHDAQASTPSAVVPEPSTMLLLLPGLLGLVGFKRKK